MVPTRADRCCYVLYSQRPDAEYRASGQGEKRPALNQPNSCDDAVEYLVDPITGSPAHRNEVEGIINLHVDGLEQEQR